MDTLATTEKQQIADIDHLREQFPQTQDLYREVCILLFFRYGMTPTANKLYQLVRKGSMTAPAEALNKFWEDLREKSRVRIEHPDLPDALKTAAGELTATLWLTAQAQAQETLASYRSEARTEIIESQAALAAAESERDASRRTLNEAQQALCDADEKIRSQDQQLAALGATNAALKSQVQHAKEEKTAHQQHLEEARRDFTTELDKLRAAAQLVEERFRAAETRSLLEVDRERSAGVKLQKELDASRTAAGQAAERQRAETASLQQQLGDLRQKIGMIEGNLHAVTANRDVIVNELKTAQIKLADGTAQASMVRVEAENWRRQAEECQRIATELRESLKLPRTPRKPKVR